ncbi:Xaa-Pro peptidase family protein [Shimazuella sp. AN120528]|uniref:M24 family metallopeptidase n=1 Tax=Shimazuella soli TaxID=1892854 RepID=UPI001F0F3BA7|nr:Xaa-Pro peptidase family protein [Shimazuella soli]MCH5583781.1 Xaa-Pro peptidase family protein [Shimazuella soli]
MINRIEQIAKWLQKDNLDAAFLTSSANVFYLTHFACDPHERLLGILIFPNREPLLVCPLLEIDRVKASGWTGEVYAHQDGDNPWKWLKDHAFSHTKNNLKFAIETDHLTYGRALNMKEELGIEVFVSIEEQIRKMRMHKTPDEMKILREAAKFADKAIQYGIDALKLGCTELEVKNQIEAKLLEQGITQMAFPTMVLFGERTALPHGEAGKRTLQKGDLVLFDLGVVVDGYRSDITRTVVFGEASEEQRRIYQAVQEANEYAIQAVLTRKVATFGQVDSVARQHIEQAGYGKYFTHRLGHGLGVEAHEYPSVSGDNSLPLAPGILFTIEPGVYVSEIGGVRIEDMVFITDDGCEVLTSSPKELQMISL